MENERKGKEKELTDWIDEFWHAFHYYHPKRSLFKKGIAEQAYQQIRQLIQQKRSVGKSRLDECVGMDGDYIDLKALMYELGVEITPRTKPVPQPIEKEGIKEELIRWLEDVYYSADEECWGRYEDKKKIWQIKAFL